MVQCGGKIATAAVFSDAQMPAARESVELLADMLYSEFPGGQTLLAGLE